MIRQLDTTAPRFDAEMTELLTVTGEDTRKVRATVTRILDDVQARGDAALVELTNRFDRQQAADMSALTINAERLATAWAAMPAPVRDALQESSDRVRTYHEEQKRVADKGADWQIVDALGNRVGQRTRAMQRVGIYIPGGKAAYPSTMIMTAIPAYVAGVAEIIACVPAPDGLLHDVLLAAAHIAGVDRLYTIGGAQAIGAMAWGTASIPRVDKIVGPGNIYVATAKALVFGQVGIEMIAGPSEVVIVADQGASPDWIIRDMFAQAEHDEMAQAILLSDSDRILTEVQARLPAMLSAAPRRAIIAKSLADRGALIKVRDLQDAVAVVNRIAPEHLQLAVADPEAQLQGIHHAGAIFLGYNTAEVVGDYTAGSSHVLPTGGTARFASPLGVPDFQVRTSIIKCSPEGGIKLNRTAAILAREEGLFAHADSAECRIDAADNKVCNEGSDNKVYSHVYRTVFIEPCL